jgi:predicted transcriptional regulator
MIDFRLYSSCHGGEICCTMSEKKPKARAKPAPVKKDDKATLEIKKELARILFTREKLEQKVIAERIGVSEKSVSNWVNDGNWRKERQRLLISKQDQLNSFYSQLEKLNEQIENESKGIPDSKQADIQIKLTNSIRNMETDLAIGDIVEAGMRFIKHIQIVGTLEQVKEFADLWNSFIQNELRKR